MCIYAVHIACVCVCVCVCVCLLCMHVYVCVCYACMYTCVCVMHACIRVCVLCMHVYVCVMHAVCVCWIPHHIRMPCWAPSSLPSSQHTLILPASAGTSTGSSRKGVWQWAWPRLKIVAHVLKSLLSLWVFLGHEAPVKQQKYFFHFQHW